MIWEKLGKIFDPHDHQLSDEYTTFAKSPQALVYAEFIRIYFCAQKKTGNGKYVSRPHFVDFDKTLKTIIKVSKEPVIELGNLGEFDEHGIFPMSVCRYGDKIFGYTSGWSRRTSVSVDMSIGLAISDDQGVTFQKYGSGGPVMTANYREPFLVGDPYVLHKNNLFHMWYIFGDKWQCSEPNKTPERFYKIAYAKSEDGLNWERDGKTIIDTKSKDECQALPTVFYKDGRYHMYFCYRDAYDFRVNTKKSYRLGYGVSDDMLTWKRDDESAGIDLSPGEWDSDMMCYPNVFECDGDFFMLYNGNEFGKNGFGLAKLVKT